MEKRKILALLVMLLIASTLIINVIASSPPVNSNPYPSNGATGVSLSISSLRITVNDSDGDTMNITFRTNASGVWKTLQTNNSVANGTYYCLNTSFINSYNTTYWWSVNTTDGNGGWDNDTYHFTTYLGDKPSINQTALSASLTDGRVTWHGQPGDTVWSNSSGDGFETLNITIIDGTGENDTDITAIKIWVGDLNDTSATITADNITLYASVDNTTFHSFGSFPSGGGNITLNATTWTWTDDPFPITDNDTIFCRLSLSIPSSQPVDTYYSSSSTAWKIYIMG